MKNSKYLQVERIFSILETLKEERFITCAALADRYHVSVNTIYSDIMWLEYIASDSIKVTRGRYGGVIYSPKRISKPTV